MGLSSSVNGIYSPEQHPRTLIPGDGTITPPFAGVMFVVLALGCNQHRRLAAIFAVAPLAPPPYRQTAITTTIKSSRRGA